MEAGSDKSCDQQSRAKAVTNHGRPVTLGRMGYGRLCVYLLRFGEGRCTKADAAALLAFAVELGLRRTLLAMLPTRLEVTSFAGMVFPF